MISVIRHYGNRLNKCGLKCLGNNDRMCFKKALANFESYVLTKNI